jgi:hypothetical protein
LFVLGRPTLFFLDHVRESENEDGMVETENESLCVGLLAAGRSRSKDGNLLESVGAWIPLLNFAQEKLASVSV